ncbi:MAG: hypothetical protein V4490_06570, partial [Pseudomonadota bacterium]
PGVPPQPEQATPTAWAQWVEPGLHALSETRPVQFVARMLSREAVTVPVTVVTSVDKDATPARSEVHNTPELPPTSPQGTSVGLLKADR